ncbi:MAG TPA: metallophosphoesterase [Vicinamibacterales bacterium]|nr:metallophosphoesterase [Vicinamibacterales bacterium]
MGTVVVPYSNIQQAFAERPDAVHKVVDDAVNTVAAGNPERKAKLLADWHQAVASLESADQGSTILSTPQNDLASRLQTMIAHQAAASAKVQTISPRETVVTPQGNATTVEETVQVKFDNNDLIGWLGTGLVIILDPTRAVFLPPPSTPEPIPDNAKIAMFSDWGTGLYGAPVITDSIQNKLRECDVILHLGDTYYSGTDGEVHDRLVGGWPKRTGVLNRALNGNHEMYSGGQGYFTALGSFFHQSSSCVALQNTNWLILGLDTSYDDFDIAPAQVAWINAMIKAAGTRKVILCSHHQPFSALDEQGPKLQAALGPLLEAGRIEAWFWGHEHRLVVYEPHPVWGVKGRCIGHGGFPSFRDTAIGGRGMIYQWIHIQPRPHAPEGLVLDGPNFWVTAAPEQYSPHGYVFLEFDGDKLFETYRTADNVGLMRWQV